MFNFQGGELVIILLLALVVLGPEKLPDAMRKAGSFYAELRKMSTGFQDEFRKAVDEPVAEMRKTADLVRESADFRNLAEGKRPEKPKSAEMGDAPADAEPDAEAVAPTFAGSTADEPDRPVDDGPVDGAGDDDADTAGDPAPSDDTVVSGDDATKRVTDASAEATASPTPESATEPNPESAVDDTTEMPKPRKNLIADANAFRPVDREQLDELRRKAEQARRDYEAAQAELDGNVDP